MEKAKKNNFFNTVLGVSEKIEKNSVVRIIRDGLVTMIPVLMIGAFALILQTLPISFYQQFITTFLNGILYKIFHIVFQATFGVMSIYMTISFSISFFSTKEVTKAINFWGVLTALICFLIMDGVAIYTPFVKMMAKIYDDRERSNREEFISWYKENESSLVGVKLTEMRGIHGAIAKKITLDLQTAIAEKSYQLFYQPQYDSEDKCIGVEALLRWPNISSLAIYPPILIQLAEECGMLDELEKGILDLAISSRKKVFAKFGEGIKISVNVTAITIQKDEYWEHLKTAYKNNPFTLGKLCIEITEKAMITINERMLNNFKECKDMGIMFAIDDFAVGQTSVNYLKEGIFDMIKLDGSLVLGINTNDRCKEIISSLVSLSNSLNITPLAEFVETKDIKDSLLEVGCKAYQGYYYSKAIPLEE